MTEVNSFEQLIKRDRAERESKQWRGTLLEYLELIKKDPTVTKMAHARIYDMIIALGTRNIADADDPRTKRLYKDDPIKVYNRTHDRSNRALFSFRLTQGRREPAGALSDGAGRLGQEFAG
jgi:hypothetical protein